MDAQDFFHFLDLPKELRLMVYEYLYPEIVTSPVTYYVDINDPDFEAEESDQYVGQRLLALTHAVPPASLLCTCQLIREEARAAVTRKIGEIQPRVTNPDDYPGTLCYEKCEEGIESRLIHILALLAAALDEDVTSTTETLHLYETSKAVDVFPGIINPGELPGILRFVHCCVAYAHKHPDKPCMTICWKSIPGYEYDGEQTKLLHLEVPSYTNLGLGIEIQFEIEEEPAFIACYGRIKDYYSERTVTRRIGEEAIEYVWYEDW